MIERELCGRVGSAIHVQDGRQGRKRRCRLERIRQFASYQRRRRIKTTQICRSILLIVKSLHAHSNFRAKGGLRRRSRRRTGRIQRYHRGTQGACGKARAHHSSLTRVRAAPLSPVVGQSDVASLGRRTTLLPRFDPRYTLVPGIKAEPPPNLQWLRVLSTVERMWARWSSGRGESHLRTHGPKFRTFPSKVTRGLHQTPPSNPRVGTPASPKAASLTL
jgi:hypothetical protein